jgi:hypothetical protein
MDIFEKLNLKYAHMTKKEKSERAREVMTSLPAEKQDELVREFIELQRAKKKREQQ